MQYFYVIANERMIDWMNDNHIWMNDDEWNSITIFHVRKPSQIELLFDELSIYHKYFYDK